MERIREWGKKVVIVVNKVDILHEGDIAKVRSFVAEKYESIMSPVRSRTRGLQPAATRSSHASAVRRSSHESAGPIAAPVCRDQTIEVSP